MLVALIAVFLHLAKNDFTSMAFLTTVKYVGIYNRVNFESCKADKSYL